MVGGTLSVPVIVPDPPDVIVIVYGAFRLPEESADVRESVAVKFPLPIEVRLAVPEALNVVPERAPVAFTVRVVLMVAACVAAQASRATAKLANLRVIGSVMSSYYNAG